MVILVGQATKNAADEVLDRLEELNAAYYDKFGCGSMGVARIIFFCDAECGVCLP